MDSVPHLATEGRLGEITQFHASEGSNALEPYYLKGDSEDRTTTFPTSGAHITGGRTYLNTIRQQTKRTNTIRQQTKREAKQEVPPLTWRRAAFRVTALVVSNSWDNIERSPLPPL